MGQSTARRRRNLRAPLAEAVVLVCARDETTEIVDARLCDLSAGGAGVVCDRYLTRQTRLLLALEPDEEGPLALWVEIRDRHREPDGWRYGLRFRALPPGALRRLTRRVLRALADEPGSAAAAAA